MSIFKEIVDVFERSRLESGKEEEPTDPYLDLLIMPTCTYRCTIEPEDCLTMAKCKRAQGLSAYYSEQMKNMAKGVYERQLIVDITAAFCLMCQDKCLFMKDYKRLRCTYNKRLIKGLLGGIPMESI